MDATPGMERRPTPGEFACRECGKPLPADTMFCSSCGAKLALGILARTDREHTGDIILAVVMFGLTNVLLVGLAGLDFLSLEAMLLRCFFLGIPFAAVMWKWYRLMREVDPDYGELWHTYWNAQLFTWFGSLFFVVAVYAFVPAAVAMWKLLFY